MSNLRASAHQALEALEKCTKHLPVHFDRHFEAISALRAALAEPERKPLNEDQMNEAYRHIWSNLPDGFGHTASEWIECAIRYAERVHGIGGG